MANLRRIAFFFSILAATPALAVTANLTGYVDTASVHASRATQPISTAAGETGTINLAILNADGTTYNLTGAQVLLTVRDRFGAALISRQATINSPSTAGTCYFPIVVADTYNATTPIPIGSYTYDVWVTDANGNRFQVVPASQWTIAKYQGQPNQAVTVPSSQQPLAQGPPGVGFSPPSTAGAIPFDTGTAYSKTTAPTQAQGIVYNGSTWMPFNQWYNVEVYGARHDGTTDDTAAIQATINAAALTCGIVYFPAGTYAVNPATSGQINVKSCVTLSGRSGATIQVKSTTGNFTAMIGQTSSAVKVSDVRIEGITFDENCTGNTTGVNIGPSNPQYVVYLTNFARVRFENDNRVLYCGVNAVVLNAGDNGSDARVTFNRFEFTRGTSSTQYDNSAVYLNATGERVIGNHFDSTLSQRAYGAVEVHGGGAVVTGNSTNWYETLVNIVTYSSGQGATSNETATTVSGNTVKNGNCPIRLWSITGQTLKNVSIIGNTLGVAQVDYNEITSCGVEMVYDTSGTLNGAFDTITIADNPITFQSDTNRSTSWNSLALSPASMWGIGLSPNGNVSNVHVHHETIVNAPVKGVALGQSGGATTTRVSFDHVRLVDAGQNAGVSSGYRAAWFINGALASVQVEHNSLHDTGTPSAKGNLSLYYQPTSASAVSYRNNRQILATPGGLSTSINTSFALDTGSIIDYGTSDVVTNYERATGTWGAFQFGQNSYVLYTDHGGTGLARPLILASDIPNGSTAYVYNQIYSRGLPMWTLSLAGNMNITGTYFHFTTSSLSGSSVSPTMLAIDPTVNQSATAGFTLFAINPTITAVGSGNKYAQTWGHDNSVLASMDYLGNFSAASLSGAGSGLTSLNASNISSGTIGAARLPVMIGANGSVGGTAGAVPAPAATDNIKFLRGDGTYATPSGTGTVTSVGSGTGLTGGPITSTGSLAIDTSIVPQLGAATNAFTGIVKAQHWAGNSGTPTANATTAQCGSGCTASATGTDTAFEVTLVGGTGAVAGQQFTVTPATTWATVPYCITVGTNAIAIFNTGGKDLYYDRANSTTSSLVFKNVGTPASSNTWKWTIRCEQ